MSLPQPDLGVLRKAQRGDERAFSLIVRAYELPVYNYVLRLVGDRSLAEDPSTPGQSRFAGGILAHQVR